MLHHGRHPQTCNYRAGPKNYVKILENNNFTVIHNTVKHTVPYWQKLTASLPEYPVTNIENDDKFDDSYDYFSYK